MVQHSCEFVTTPLQRQRSSTPEGGQTVCVLLDVNLRLGTGVSSEDYYVGSVAELVLEYSLGLGPDGSIR